MGKKLLIIDDNGQDRKIMQRFLNKAGYWEILMAETGEEGLKTVKSEKPDLIILDTILPGIDGYETCRQIRETQGPTTPKIIVLTGSVDAVDAVKAKKVGADDYCVKTGNCLYLIEAINKLI